MIGSLFYSTTGLHGAHATLGMPHFYLIPSMIFISPLNLIRNIIPLSPSSDRSIVKAISLSDIKSLIAFSTISQISYMFVAINGASTLVSPFHIIRGLK